LTSRDKLARSIQTMEQLHRIPIKLVTNAPERHKTFINTHPIGIEAMRNHTVAKKQEPMKTNNKSDD